MECLGKGGQKVTTLEYLRDIYKKELKMLIDEINSFGYLDVYVANWKYKTAFVDYEGDDVTFQELGHTSGIRRIMASKMEYNQITALSEIIPNVVRVEYLWKLIMEMRQK